MKKCQACKEPLPADAHWRRRYCANKKCRSRGYRKRKKKKEEKQIRTLKRAVSTSAPAKPEGYGAFVVACPCGQRLRIQVSPLVENANTSPASLVGPTEPIAPALPSTEALPVVHEHEPATVGASAHLEDGPFREDRQEAAAPHLAPSGIDEAGVLVPPGAMAEQALVPEPLPTEAPDLEVAPFEAPTSEAPPAEAPPSAAPPAEALTSGSPACDVPTSEVATPEAPAPAPRLRTYELYAEQRGVPLLLDEALYFDGTRWLLRPGIRLLLGERPEEGFGLAGSPGRWPEVYGAQSPSRFGHGERWAVMYVVERRRQRSQVVPVEMLRTILGARWRELLGETDSS